MDIDDAKRKFKDCKKCKHFYDLDFDGFHTLCAELHCHLCAGNSGWCIDYEEGEAPKGKEKGSYK